MPASITLTVSHLPSSTSFFLSALQPLNYAYRGRCDNTIGFGSATNRSAPADFWITQEIPGVPAGAAHVAFPAPSRHAVQNFFTAALKAGGKLHGEPAVRDSSGYYSAAVIDFDGNSIEAVFRPNFSDDKENHVKSLVSTSRSVTRRPSDARTSVSRAPPSEVSRTTSRAAPAPQSSSTSNKPPSGDMIDSILAEARNAANVAREIVQQARNANTTTPNNGNGDAIVGALLGVAAGAAISYAFTNNKSSNKSENTSPRQRRSSLSRSVTDPPPSAYRAPQRAIEPPSSHYSSSPITMLDHDDSASTVRPAARSRHGSAVSTGFGNSPSKPAGSTVSKASSRRSSGPKMIEAPPSSYKAPSPHTSSSSSHHSSSSSRHRGSPSSSSRPTTVIRTTEEVRLRSSTHPSRASSSTTRPEAYPLPPSRANTWTSGSKASRSTFKSKGGKESVMDREIRPEDSISQISVGSRR